MLRVCGKNIQHIKYSQFHNNFTAQLMNYRILNEKSAFEVNEVLIENYKQAFQDKSKFSAILSSVIASDAKYIDLAEHYIKYYIQGFN